LAGECQSTAMIYRIHLMRWGRGGRATQSQDSLSGSEILDVDVSAESGVVGQVPAVVVGIFVDDDGIAVPEPIRGVVVIVGRHTEVEAAEPETFAVSSAKAEHVAAAKAAGEVAVLPSMIDVIVGIVAAGIVANPCVIVVDVRRLGMIGFVLEGASVLLCMAFRCVIFGCAIFRGTRRSASHGGGAVRRHVTVANIASRAFLLSPVLSSIGVGQQERRDAKSEQQSEQAENILHIVSSGKEKIVARRRAEAFLSVRRKRRRRGYRRFLWQTESVSDPDG